MGWRALYLSGLSDFFVDVREFLPGHLLVFVGTRETACQVHIRGTTRAFSEDPAPDFVIEETHIDDCEGTPLRRVRLRYVPSGAADEEESGGRRTGAAASF
jgi:hypothetical protein